jgi:hypothetical protein
MEMRELFGLAGVPFIIAMVEMVKRSFPGLHGETFAPLAVFFGIVINGAVGMYLGIDTFPAIMTGIVAGLVASGLYSGGKAVVEMGSED